jgi:hypothetical protein
MRDLLPKIVCSAGAMSLCIGLGACVTAAPPAPADLGTLRMALTQPIPALRSRAEGGEARAQYALALVHAYGVQGGDIDPALASQWRRRALAPRGYMPITTYVAGLNGKPGRVVTINTPRYELGATQATQIDLCAAALADGDSNLAAADRCAGPQEFARLQLLWALATAHR